MTLFIFANDKLSRIVDTAFDWLSKFRNNLTTNQITDQTVFVIRQNHSGFDKQQATARKIFLKKNNKRCQVFERLKRN